MPYRHHPASPGNPASAALEDRRVKDRRKPGGSTPWPGDLRVRTRRTEDLQIERSCAQDEPIEFCFPDFLPSQDQPPDTNGADWHSPDRHAASASWHDQPGTGEPDLVEYSLLVVLLATLAIATIKSLDVAVFDGILRLQANLTSAL